MKVINNIFLAFSLILLLGFTSCTDYLDKAPLSDIDPSEPYKNFRNFQGFTEELYNAIPIFTAQSSHNSFNLGEDIIWQMDLTYPLATQFDQGNYWAWDSASGTSWFKPGGKAWQSDNEPRNQKGNLWGLSWYAIYKANVGIANLDKLTDATVEERNLIEGQLYFFRGWFHFMLMQYWGGLPYIDEAIPADHIFRNPRLSYQETADKAAADFQRAADLLPIDWDQTAAGTATLGNNNLRINKIMALAYKGKNLLWAGSPLMNSVSTGNRSYNTDYCKRAADAFAEALALTEATGRYDLADFSDFTDVIYTRNQSGRVPGLKEAIFMENLVQSATRWRWNMVNDFRPPALSSTGVKKYPTANYIQNYGMKNGLPINDLTKKDAKSGYDPEYPWKNRDPRFYKDIVYDGIQCSQRQQDENIQYASLYTGGLFRATNSAKSAITGFMNTKLCPQYTNDWDGYQDGNTLVLSYMRLADVYLMYAEAVAMGYGSPSSKVGSYSLSGVDAINKVRARAGVDPVHSDYLGSSESFISELRRERAVELAFEGHRFVDLRRWLLLTERPYNIKTAIEFDRANDVASDVLYANPENGHVLNLREVVLVERQLSDRHYWFPFLRKDVMLYEEFGQNPGW